MNEPEKIGKAYESKDRYGSIMMCLSCEREMEFERCDHCSGEGWEEVTEDDPSFLHDKPVKDCGSCYGTGGDYWCDTKECETKMALEIVPKPDPAKRPCAS